VERRKTLGFTKQKAENFCPPPLFWSKVFRQKIIQNKSLAPVTYFKIISYEQEENSKIILP